MRGRLEEVSWASIGGTGAVFRAVVRVRGAILMIVKEGYRAAIWGEGIDSRDIVMVVK